ncbi:NUMOD4 domain-containing protein [Paenibacillus bouchesdurhonensis]|uniref:NUMOD4 domain-containing protein n=1 Tax=Paenibacillus bouchesdurhonensis TaxID=1870990 RepID=UPI000DA609F9|nr:NUMOD4 domain-containing protein [Paenibacillus bouchesdurhonensis]
MAEIWKDAPGYEGYYQVSNTGKVRSLDRTVLDKNGRSMQYKGVLLTPQYNEFGYQKVVLMKGGRGKSFKIHQLVALAFIKNEDGHQCVNHKNGDKTNNNVQNLEWCSFSYNIQHAYDTGLKAPYERYGEKNPKAKLTNEEVEEIRSLHKRNGGPFGTMYFSRVYGVHKDTITNLIKGKTYARAGGL